MRVPLHIVEERRRKLRDLIRHDGFLPLAQICKRLDVSTATARRDLAVIESEGHITRTHGGALADYNASFASPGQRARRARTGKSIIAQCAGRHAPRTGVVYLDAGTTVLGLARLIAKRRGGQNLTVVTNNLSVASVLGGTKGVTLHLVGGQFLHRQSVLFGPQSVDYLRQWKFDAAFLGGESMNTDGIWNSQKEISTLQRAVLARTRQAFFCLDKTKLGKSTPHHVAPWTDVGHLVSDATVTDLKQHTIDPKILICSK